MATLLIKVIVLSLCILALQAVIATAQTKYEKATFAGGCFWCVQPPFEKLKGVAEVVSGYTGGTGENPTYEDYAKKGHIEAVRSRMIRQRYLILNFWTCFGGRLTLQTRADNSLIADRNTAQRSSTRTKNKRVLPKNRRRNWQNPGGFKNP